MLFFCFLIAMWLYWYLYFPKDSRMILAATDQTADGKNRAKKNKTHLSLLVASLLIFLGALLFTSAAWAMDYFGEIGIDEIMYTLSQPLKGTDSSQILNFLSGPVLSSLVFSAMITFILWLLFFWWKNNRGIELKPVVLNLFLIMIGLGTLAAGTSLGINEFGYAEVKAYFFEKSNIYEKYYVDPAKPKLTFPEQKRNLIYIYSESLETTFLSKELGGAQEENLLPNLSELAMNEGVNFSNSKLLGGAMQVPGTGFTVGGMVAQSAGIPLKLSSNLDHNSYGDTDNFLPGAYSLGEILAKEGYEQTLFIGSDAKFAGRDKFFSQHGNYQIFDYYHAIEEGWIPADYHTWWGYEDAKLFDFAKDSLQELADSGKPFNFTMLTADTHFPDGLMTDQTPVLFDQQYSNVIHYSDQMIGEFIRWIQQQPFYENTTIVLSGDHLSMDTNFFNELPEDYERSVFNLILNSPAQAKITDKQDKNRVFSTVDLFPTTLAALGVNIPSNRLGIGTNLFADRPTIPEEIGFDAFTKELSQQSDFYQEKIMQGSEPEVPSASTE